MSVILILVNQNFVNNNIRHYGYKFNAKIDKEKLGFYTLELYYYLFLDLKLKNSEYYKIFKISIYLISSNLCIISLKRIGYQ